MDNNTSFFINHLIYAIYNSEDFENLKVHILESLRAVIPFQCGSICMADDEDPRHLLGMATVVPERYRIVEEKYLLIEEQDISRWQLQMNSATVLRVTDLMDKEQWEKTVLYQTCYQPYGLYFAVDMTIVSGGQLLGVLSLYRQETQGDFSEDDLFLLKLLNDHLNARFFREKDTGSLAEKHVGRNQSLQLSRKYGLTVRETEITALVLDGKSNESIAEELNITVNTLKKHLQHIYRKTGVTSRVRLETISLRLGYASDNRS